MAAEVSLASLREGMKTVLAASLAKAIGGGDASAAADTSAAADAAASAAHASVGLERAAYNSSVRAWRVSPNTPHRQHYAATIRAVTAALGEQVGPFPDDIMGRMLMRGAMTADALIAASLTETPPPDPREQMRRLFVQTLVAAGHGSDRELALAVARDIEVSCYNAAVRASKESEDPPRRQWDSAAFIDIYGTRCGTIAGLLDPQSSACRAYGATLAPRLFDGTISPGALGDMSAKDLCPQATVTERAEIARRAVQKVQIKESTLFSCTHCHERRCTYQEVQRRSLDEAPDYLCLCLSCNRRFTGGRSD